MTYAHCNCRLPMFLACSVKVHVKFSSKKQECDPHFLPDFLFFRCARDVSRTEFLGAVPKRHRNLPPGNARMFAMARGVDGAPALDMTKWFDSNYHYEVPELEAPVVLQPNFDGYLVRCTGIVCGIHIAVWRRKHEVYAGAVHA